MMYVAVVFAGVSGRSSGGWECFVDKQKSSAIKKAMIAREKWEKSPSMLASRNYKILVGTLEQIVETPQNYELKSINEEEISWS